jgi:hypothetical protein
LAKSEIHGAVFLMTEQAASDAGEKAEAFRTASRTTRKASLERGDFFIFSPVTL